MKRIYIVILLSVLFLSVNAKESNKKTVIIAHPTVSAVKVLTTLSKVGLLETDNLHFIGVYHNRENYDYKKTKECLDTAKISMSLQCLRGELIPENLYKKNPLTDSFKELFNKSCGTFFLWGPDIPPVIYGEEKNDRTKVTDTYRHYFEASFVFHLLGGYQNSEYRALLEGKPNYLVKGICLGLQTMNIATGGTLIQDIPSEIYNSDELKGLQHLSNEQVHRNYYRQMSDEYGVTGFHMHTIKMVGTFLTDLTGTDSKLKPTINSYHHQAIERLGKGFKVAALSADGKIIEAIYHTEYPNVFAVQFHPERPDFYLFENLIKFEPEGESKYLSEWIDKESMEFHYNYWRGVNKKLKEIEVQKR
jgi:putative glutamine amidotransferase